ncbi:cytochrome P450 [Mycena vulgaris]|nr:cytochrome P450 [Mycena vulgaris]
MLISRQACHLYFKRYEPTDPISLTFLLLVLPATLALILAEETKSMFMSLLITYSLYYSGLLVSIITYRVSPAHSLAKYPGPLACKISKLWLLYVSSQGKLHLYIKHLHDKYGPVVRIGPNELSIVDSSLMPSILGSKGMPKGPLWEGRTMTRTKSGQMPDGILINSRDLKRHAEARKAWNTAFVPAAIKGYEAMLIQRVTQLVDALGEQKGRTVDLSRWFSFFSFDFMGDLAFGGGFELMRDGDKEGLWHILERGLLFPALTQQIPWCIQLVMHFPMIGQDMRALARFGAEQSKRRLQEGSVHNDIFYYLLEDKRSKGEPYPFPLMITNAILAIVAGADTTATVLSNALFYLLSHPESYKRLQAEVDENFPRGHGTKDPTDAANSKEALRLQPPVPTSLQRAPAVGDGSKVLGEGFIIPAGTAVNDAFIPFSTGPANCLGRNLAMLEMRMVLAHVIRAFELSFEEGYDEGRWEAELKDYFVLQKGRLPVALRGRSS